MGNYTILSMFENPRRGRQARNFTTNAPKILDLKSSSEQIFSLKLPLGAPAKFIRETRARIADAYGNRFIKDRVFHCICTFMLLCVSSTNSELTTDLDETTKD